MTSHEDTCSKASITRDVAIRTNGTSLAYRGIMTNAGINIQARVIAHFGATADHSVDKKEQSPSNLGVGRDVRSRMNQVDEFSPALRHQLRTFQLTLGFSYGADEHFIAFWLVILNRSKNWQGDVFCAHVAT